MHNQLERSIRVARKRFFFFFFFLRQCKLKHPRLTTTNVNDLLHRENGKTAVSSFFVSFHSDSMKSNIQNPKGGASATEMRNRGDLSMGKLRMFVAAEPRSRDEDAYDQYVNFKFRCYAIFARLLLLEQQRNTHYFTF